jgi:hypothetical protein
MLAELHRRDRVLSVTGWIHLGLAAAFAVGMAVDGRTVLGISPWVKPFKFAVSITIYVWTIAWLLGHVKPVFPRAGRIIGVGTAVAMLTEIACIAGQSLRGVPSHFNVTSAFNGIVFSVMGVMITVNSLLAGWLLLLFFDRRVALPRPYLWGIRLGLAVMLAGSLEGMAMVVRQAHTVGAADGGPGLPLVNWSTRHGDLRVAHALGLHALQVLPLVGWLASRSRDGLTEAQRTAAVFAFATAYLMVFGLLLWQAVGGRPLLAAL